MKKHVLITLLLITSLVFTSVSQVNYQWVKSIGGTSGETSFDITTDNQGFVYITGKLASLDSVDFNPNGTTPIKLKVGLASCFIAKYDSIGNCIWAKNLQQGLPFGVSVGSAITTDNERSVYVAGVFGGNVDFDPSSGTASANSILNGADVFIVKYDSLGNFKWVKTVGGSGEEFITDVVVDELNSGVYISGIFDSDTVVFSNTTDTLFNKGEKDAFIARYGLNGILSWKHSVGGSLDDVITDIDADDYYLVVTGAYEDTLIFNQTGTPPDTLLPSAGPSTFYGKYMLDGSYGWMQRIGGALGGAVSTGVAIENNNIHLTGVFFGIVEVDTNNTTLASVGTNKNVFVNKYNIGGNLAWAKNISPENANTENSATSTGIVVDEQDNVYVAGYFSGSVDFDPSSNNLLNMSNGVASDFYFSKFTDAGTVVWAKTFGSDLVDTMVSIAIDSKNNIYLSGEYKDTVDFDPGIDVANRGSLGNEDLFIAKYAQGTGTITGTVTYGNSNTLLIYPGNKAQLYTQVPNDGNATMQLVDEVDIDAAAGTYTFYDVCAGTYYILVIAGNDAPSTLAATYYGDNIYWASATAINVLPDSIYSRNINMIQSLPLTGTATLSGYVLEGGGFDRIQGDPIPDRDIVLQGDPSSIIVAHTLTDTNGYYQFNNVLADSCYKIYVNIPGLPMDSTHHECPTITDSIINLDFVADSASIGIIPTTTGIKQNSNKKQVQLLVYPNPNKGLIYAKIELQKESTVKIELYDLVGKKVLDLGTQTVKVGQSKIQINTKENNIGSGIYFLKAIINNNDVFTEKLIQID